MPSSARDNISWERDWPAPTNAAVASRSPSRLSSSTSDIALHNANPHKRSRVESDASGGNEQSKDIEMKSTALSAKAIRKIGDGKGQVLEYDSDRKADGEE